MIVKKIIKVILIFIIALAVIFIANYARINIRYLISKSDYKEEFKVQGIQDGYVPQALAYSDKYNVVLQTSYNSKHDVSKLFITDFESGNLLKELKLKKVNGEDNSNHVGGIATDNKDIWITNDYEVNIYDLEEIMNDETNDSVNSIKDEKLPIRGDFALYKDNTLWIGDFCLSPFYKVPNNDPKLNMYKVEEKEIDFNKPEKTISLPKMVQGMWITEDKILFTESFTYLINSNLAVYKNITNEGRNDLKFDKSNFIKNIKLPPMAEGFFEKEGRLYILFENSADTYNPALPKLKNIISIDLNKIN